MKRRRQVSVGIILAAVALSLACSVSVEEKLLHEFFRASKLRDEVTLGNFATASFDPRTDGVVTSFTITSIGAEATSPLLIKGYADQLEKARADEKEFRVRKIAYQDKNMEGIERIVAAESKKQPVGKKDQTLLAEWDKWRAETAEHAKKISAIQHELGHTKAIAELSLARPGKAFDPTQFDAELISKVVTLDADVRSPSGQSEKKTLVATLQRVRAAAMTPPDGRWIVAEIKTQGK